MIKYKGYMGHFSVDLDGEIIHGEVIGTRDMITFQGQTVAEAKQAFVDSVEDYLAFCAERGEEPEKPFSGKVLLRMPPEVHRALSVEAEQAGTSINSYILAKLDSAIMKT